MTRKDDTAARWVTLIVALLAVLNLYWVVSFFVGPSQINLAYVVAGLGIQAIGIAGALNKLTPFIQRQIPGAIFVFAILFGASMEWFGLFHGDAKGRVSPSIWAQPK